MTDTSSLSHLIERLEKATDGSRELDALIECEVRRFQAYDVGLNDAQRAHWNPVGAKGEVIDTQGFTRYHAPRYSQSIDAAMTLVPQSDDPTWRWRIVEFQEWNKGNSYWFWRARISGWPNMRPVYECGEHPIPALALCIAALKARAT